jgi:hypothetical protein
MSSATHITIGGNVKFQTADVEFPDGKKGKALHVYDLDDQTHYEILMGVETAHRLSDQLRGDGIIVATEMPNGGNGLVAT